jgi:hypothetical protein
LTLRIDKEKKKTEHSSLKYSLYECCVWEEQENFKKGTTHFYHSPCKLFDQTVFTFYIQQNDIRQNDTPQNNIRRMKFDRMTFCLKALGRMTSSRMTFNRYTPWYHSVECNSAKRHVTIVCIIKWAPLIKSSLLLRIDLQNIKTLQ